MKTIGVNMRNLFEELSSHFDDVYAWYLVKVTLCY